MNHGLPPEDWDARLQHATGSILQSRPWAEVQAALARETYWAEDTGWQWLAGLRESRGLRYLLCTYGPAASDEAFEQAVQSLMAAGRELRTDFVRLEPQNGAAATLLERQGAILIHELSPQYTRLIDLEKDEEVLRSELSSGHRNRINGAERRGIAVKQTTEEKDFNEFAKMLRETAERSKVTFFPESYYRTLMDTLGASGLAKLYMATVEGEPVAASMMYDWGDTRYYAHAGARQDLNRKAKANVVLVWQALLDAKAAGLKHLDLWGTAPEGDENHHLAGLSMFKQGFGGRQVEYAGTWDIPLKPSKYRLYSLYRRLRGMD